MRSITLLALLAVPVLALPACASNSRGGAPSYARDTAAAAINDTLDTGRTLKGDRADSVARDSAARDTTGR